MTDGRTTPTLGDDMKNSRLLAVPAAALALGLTLAACATDAASPAPSATQDGAAPARAAEDAPEDGATHNDADTEFAQMMIVHHEGAIEMAELAVTRATDQEVRALAARIAAAQGPEIELMSGWLDAWGEEQPDEADMGGMGHEGMEMAGMDQASAMAELSGLGGDVDRRFLELMIEHHRGAIVMAEAERADGASTEATRLAQTIIDDQTAEIAEMTHLLNAL